MPTGYQPGPPNDIRGSKVDQLSTKNNDMKQRRVINAADAQDTQDYITLNDLQTRLEPSAYTDTTNAKNITTGTLPNSVLPYPGATILGGIKSIAQVPHNFIQWIDTKGNPILAQPAFSDLSGTISLAQFPSDPAVPNQFVTSINTGGAVLRAQPSFSNLSGAIAPSQVPASLKPPANFTVPGKAIGTTYQNTQATPLFVFASFQMQPGLTDNLGIYCDTNSTPSTLIANVYVGSVAAVFIIPAFFIVLPNYFYRTAVLSGTIFVNTWVEWF